MQEIEDNKEEQEERSFNIKGVARTLAVLYVFAIYFLIFLKLLFLK